MYTREAEGQSLFTVLHWDVLAVTDSSVPPFTGQQRNLGRGRSHHSLRSCQSISSVAPAPHEHWLCLESPVPMSLWYLWWHRGVAQGPGRVLAAVAGTETQ